MLIIFVRNTQFVRGDIAWTLNLFLQLRKRSGMTIIFVRKADDEVQANLVAVKDSQLS